MRFSFEWELFKQQIESFLNKNHTTIGSVVFVFTTAWILTGLLYVLAFNSLPPETKRNIAIFCWMIVSLVGNTFVTYYVCIWVYTHSKSSKNK